jgi:hypothetical protein
MKKRKTSKKDANKNIKVADLKPEKDAIGGRHHHQRLQSPPPRSFDPVTGAGKWDY